MNSPHIKKYLEMEKDCGSPDARGRLIGQQPEPAHVFESTNKRDKEENR